LRKPLLRQRPLEGPIIRGNPPKIPLGGKNSQWAKTFHVRKLRPKKALREKKSGPSEIGEKRGAQEILKKVEGPKILGTQGPLK